MSGVLGSERIEELLLSVPWVQTLDGNQYLGDLTDQFCDRSWLGE